MDVSSRGRVLPFSAWQKLRLVVLPGSIPSIFTGLHYGLTHAWIALVSIELVASSEGLGYLLVRGRQMFWLDTVLVSMIVIGLVGFVTDKVPAIVEQHLQRWRIDDAQCRFVNYAAVGLFSRTRTPGRFPDPMGAFEPFRALFNPQFFRRWRRSAQRLGAN